MQGSFGGARCVEKKMDRRRGKRLKNKGAGTACCEGEVLVGTVSVLGSLQQKKIKKIGLRMY